MNEWTSFTTKNLLNQSNCKTKYPHSRHKHSVLVFHAFILFTSAFPGGGFSGSRLRRSHGLFYLQLQIPAAPRGSPDIPKSTIRYNVSSGSCICPRLYLVGSTRVHPCKMPKAHHHGSFQFGGVTVLFQGFSGLLSSSCAPPVTDGNPNNLAVGPHFVCLYAGTWSWYTSPSAVPLPSTYDSPSLMKHPAWSFQLPVSKTQAEPVKLVHSLC